MAAPAKKRLSDFFIDKTEIQKIVAQQHEELGIVPDPMMTVEKLHKMMLAQGIRPEDNILSSLIIADRYEE